MKTVKTRRTVIGIFALILLVTTVPSTAETRTWTDKGSDWKTADNWNPEGYSTSDNLTVLSGTPTASSNVIADYGGSITLNGSAAVADFGEYSLYIAEFSSSSSQLNILNGANLSNKIACLGHWNGTGIATVDGVGSTWNSSALIVGYNGTGILNITDGGAVSNTSGTLGSQSGGSGTATVGGVGSTWTNSGSLHVGYLGTGTLNIQAGGTVSNTNGCVGYLKSSTATVSGTGATWTNSDSLSIGFMNTGTLSITNGGTVSNTSCTLGDTFSSSSGTVEISGAGSEWTNSGELVIGNQGTGIVNITDGGTVSNTHGSLGDQSGASGEVTVSGVGSKWTNSEGLCVGNYGTGVLSITDSGTVSNMYSYLGFESGSSGKVTVSGAGSKCTNSSVFYVGHEGTGELSITNGGAVSNAGCLVGGLGGSSGTATVSGAGSTWTNSGEFVTGHYGTGVLNITGGGAVVSNATSFVGRHIGSSGTVAVSSVGSKWTNSIALYIGHYGTGVLNISDGGTVSSTDGYLGDLSGSSGTVAVSGAGSKWTNSNEFYIGKDGAGILNITEGGEVVSDTFACLGYLGSSSGEVTVSGTGSEWTNGGALYVGYYGVGTLTVSDDAAVSTTGNLDIATASSSNGTVNLEGGSLTAGAIEARNGTAAFNWTGGTLGITGGGGLTLDGGLLGTTVNINNGKELNVTNATAINYGVTLTVDGGTGTFETDTLTLASGANIDLDSGRIDIDSTFSNNGLVRMGNTGAATIYAGLLNNNGEINVGENCSATFYGSFSGNGCTGTGTVNLDCNIKPGASPGEMSFGGDVVFGWGTQLEAELGGTTPGTQYDVLSVAGDLTLAGMLNVVLYDGFNPDRDDTFDILNWGGDLNGQFDAVNLPNLSGELDWNTDYLYITGVITVIPEPATAGLLLLGAIAMLRRRKR